MDMLKLINGYARDPWEQQAKVLQASVTDCIIMAQATRFPIPHSFLSEGNSIRRWL